MRPKEIVKSGYNKIASTYAAARTADSEDVQLLNILVERLPKEAVVLDAGCGSGFPVAQFLARSFQVTGVDFSGEQLRLAKRTVQDVALVCADLSSMPFFDDAFDGICSYYAIIHVPRSEHSKLLRGFHRILRPGGLALLCLGAGDLPEDWDKWQGAEMYWSHYDSMTNLMLMKEAGFDVLWFKTVQDPIDPHAIHLFVLGQKRGLRFQRGYDSTALAEVLPSHQSARILQPKSSTWASPSCSKVPRLALFGADPISQLEIANVFWHKTGLQIAQNGPESQIQAPDFQTSQLRT